MNDSFFTARSDYDRQAATWSAGTCEEIMEACTRRIVKVEGPMEAAKRVQRIADICAGVHVLPIEHWQKVDPPNPPKTPKTRRERFFDFIGNPTMAWLTGLVTGYLIGRP